MTVTGDLLDGILTGEPEPGLIRKLEILGRLEVYTKQMDMVDVKQRRGGELRFGILRKTLRSSLRDNAPPAPPVPA